MASRQDILDALLDHCAEQGLFAHAEHDVDLVEAGYIDSMGLVQLQALIEDNFGILIATSIFVAELRTLDRIVAYLDAEIRAGRARFIVPATAE